MDEWAWHDVLYGLWCLGDLERVEELEERIRRVSEVNMMPFSNVGVRNLNSERSAVLSAIQRSLDGGVTASGMPEEIMLTFPGMPHYKKPVS